MRNNPTVAVLQNIVAEWLEEWEAPDIVHRHQPTLDLEKLKRILAIIGPRRAGKTYYMYQIIQSVLQTGRFSREDILFVDFEDYRLVGFTADNIDDLFAAFHQIVGRYPRFLFFDEVQHLSDWQRVLRTLHNRRRFKIIISGSNSKLLGKEVTAELRGRYDSVIMLPFSFMEYLTYRGISWTPAALRTAVRGNVMAAFDDYMRHGGFPEVVMTEIEIERRRLLQSYYRIISYHDIIDRYNIKARYLLDSLMNDVLENYSSIFSITRFEKQLKSNGIPGSKRTISNYLHYLEEAFFVFVNEKFSYSPRRRIMNPKKIYLSDSGFAAVGRPFTENRGRILENVVATDLIRREAELYYFKGRHECDFVVKKDRRITHAIQVCWELNERTEKREFDGLIEACRVLNLTAGSILTYSQEEERQRNGLRISILPVWKWLLFPDVTGSISAT